MLKSDPPKIDKEKSKLKSLIMLIWFLREIASFPTNSSVSVPYSANIAFYSYGIFLADEMIIPLKNINPHCNSI